MITFGNPVMLLAALFALPGIYLAVTRDTQFKKIMGVTKSLTVLLIAVALASPSITVQEQRMQQPEAVVLQDDSRSTQIMEKPDLEFEDVRTVKRTISSGNSSDLRTGLLQNVKDDRSYILVSDLRSSSSLDGVAEEIKERNATVHVLKTETEKEAAITVKGPDTTYPGVENTFTVKISSTGKTPVPEVYLNGEKVEIESSKENEWFFTETFNEKGFNSIEARIDSNDRFPENNEYYKTVEVADKPEIFILGSKGRISQKFEDLYSFESSENVPKDLSDYYAVIAKKEFDESELASYTAEGNGLIYTGDYEESNQLLPVKESDYEDKSIKMMLLIDASEASGGECTRYATESQNICLERSSEGGAIERTKQIAYMLLDSETLPPGSRVGAIYYNQDPYVISEPKPLGEDNHREKLKGGIANIPTGGNSLHDDAIKAGQEILEEEGNLLLISDGEITKYGEHFNVTRDSRDLAENSEAKIISIMVGDDPNTGYMETVARLSGGYSISDVESQKINFQGGGATGEAVSLIKNDDSHFITRGVDIEGTTSGFDGVAPKRGAKQLVSGTNSQPFLTTWRYGLGRVAAFSAGSTDLGAVMYRDSELVSRTLSWAVGDPQRKEDARMEISDAQKGEKVKVEASYPVEELNRQRENLYTATLEVEERGVHSFNDHLYSYNYKDEIEEVGYGDTEKFVSETGGKVFTSGQRSEIADAIKSFSDEEVEKQKDLTGYFLTVALLVFLSEIGYRKRRGKK